MCFDEVNRERCWLQMKRWPENCVERDVPEHCYLPSDSPGHPKNLSNQGSVVQGVTVTLPLAFRTELTAFSVSSFIGNCCEQISAYFFLLPGIVCAVYKGWLAQEYSLIAL